MAEGNKSLMNRRQLMVFSGAAACSAALPFSVKAQQTTEKTTHGLAVFDDLKYPAGFSHFDYIIKNVPVGVLLHRRGLFDRPLPLQLHPEYRPAGGHCSSW